MGRWRIGFLGGINLDALKSSPIKSFKLTQPVEISPETTLLELYEGMFRLPQYLGVVRNGNPGQIKGIVTPADATRYIIKEGQKGKAINLTEIPMELVMNKDYLSVNENDSVDTVRKMMMDNNFHKILVLDQEEKNPRMITRTSLLAQIIERTG